MDYTTQKLGFKIKKAIRYVRLYGVRRTMMKVKGQYHMKKTFSPLPSMVSPIRPGGHLGIIGCGNYAFSTIAFYLRSGFGGVIRGAMDRDLNKAASLFKSYGLQYYTDDAEVIVADPDIDLVYIASNHASHAEYAIRCIDAGKHVHIEKPHVVSEDQLDRLAAAMKKRPDVKVFLGFNRPRSRLFKQLQDFLSQQSGPLMINWFVAGHEIPEDHWYFDEEEGGRVLGNLCHWTDLTLQLVGEDNAFPCTIVPATPAGAKSDYVVSIIFADRSCASITFSAKGHTFEGVREVVNIHKGDVLANLTDFQSLTVDIVDKQYKKKLLHRTHGHGANIMNSVTNEKGETPTYIIATAKLFLSIKKAKCLVREWVAVNC
jgi:predicted dehydrogenase